MPRSTTGCRFTWQDARRMSRHGAPQIRDRATRLRASTPDAPPMHPGMPLLGLPAGRRLATEHAVANPAKSNRQRAGQRGASQQPRAPLREFALPHGGDGISRQYHVLSIPALVVARAQVHVANRERDRAVAARKEIAINRLDVRAEILRELTGAVVGEVHDDLIAGLRCDGGDRGTQIAAAEETRYHHKRHDAHDGRLDSREDAACNVAGRAVRVIRLIGHARLSIALAAGTRCRKRARWFAMRSLVVPAARIGRVRRMVMTAALGVSLVQGAAASRAVAQDSVQTAPRHKRSTIYAIAGAVLGGLAGVLFSQAGGSSGHSGCGIPCFSWASAAAGGGVGYLIGRQSDRRYALRYRGGIGPLDIRSLAAPLAGAPTAIAVVAGDVAVAGNAGVQLFNSDSGLRVEALRASGLHGITHVALAPESGWLVVGSPS